MRNNHFFKTQILLAALAAAVIAPICAFSQQRSGSSRPVIKDSDIYVPEKVLKASYTDTDAKEMLDEYVKAFDPSNLPKSFDEKDQNRRRCARQCQGSLGNLYNLIFDATAKANEAGNYPVSLELQEVTKYSDVWFKKLYNKARELNGPATEIDKAIRTKNAALFAQARKQYSDTYNELQKILKSPERLSGARHKQIEDANRERRRREYIAQRKKQMMEEYEAQRAAEEELNRAAGGSRK